MRLLSSLLKRRRLTAAYSFMKALTLPRLVVKVRPLCSRGSANVVEEGVPVSDLIVLHVRAESELFSRSASDPIAECNYHNLVLFFTSPASQTRLFRQICSLQRLRTDQQNSLLVDNRGEVDHSETIDAC